MEASAQITKATKIINLTYLSLVALLVAGGTFEGLSKLLPEQLPLMGHAPIAISDSISQTAAAPMPFQGQREAPIRVPIISTVPLDTVHVASPKFQMNHHKAAPHRSETHSKATPLRPLHPGKSQARVFTAIEPDLE